MFKDLIRGGQTHIHGMRMAMQIIRFALLAAILCGVSMFGWRCYRTIPSGHWQQVFEYYIANIQVGILPDNKQAAEQIYYPIGGGKPYKRQSIKILEDTRIKKIVQRTGQYLIVNVSYAMRMTGVACAIIFAFWLLKGILGQRKTHKRGTTYISPFLLKWKLILFSQASYLKLGSLPLVKNSETSHILICGTTGSGKSNCFNLLMPQIRKKGQRAIIFDPTGEYVARYYIKGKDCILNPFDQRSEGWNIWSEFEHNYELETIAATLIQGKSINNDPFWIESAKNLFIQAVLAYKNTDPELRTNQALIEFLLNSSIEKLREILGQTSVRSLLEVGGEKPLISVRSTLMNHIKPLSYLNDDKEPFSIKEWVQDESERNDSWLFLSCRADQREALKPLISTWLDIAINALMSSKVDADRRFWFIIDELPALQKIRSFKTALAEARKYGGCIVAGVQSLNQIHALYGHDNAKSMLNLFNTEIYFRTIESSCRELISQALGEVEESELYESISYGANSTQDGVSNSIQSKNRRLVTAAELRHLEDLEAIIQLSQVNNITKIRMPYIKPKVNKDNFTIIEKDTLKSDPENNLNMDKVSQGYNADYNLEEDLKGGEVTKEIEENNELIIKANENKELEIDR
jgi:type IV conjugative transfer system coupling protein TraD